MNHHVRRSMQAFGAELFVQPSEQGVHRRFDPRFCSDIAATENRVTAVTQSRASRSESSVSASPNPNGLTTPAATTATRSEVFFPVALPNWAMSKRQNCYAIFYCFPKGSILQMTRNGNGSLEVGGLSVEFIQWRFEIR